MKNLLYIFLALIFIAGCKEEPVEYTLMDGVVSNRKVIIEEFTGVTCTQCPQGSVELENLLDFYGDNLITISIHSGFFASPHSDNTYDFRTDDGEAITSFLGGPDSWPSAVINQKQFPAEPTKQIKLQKWQGYIASELASAPLIEIQNHIDYDETTREMELKIDLKKIHNDLPSNLKLSVLVTESNIVDRQSIAVAPGFIPDYVHRHVFRDAITSATGDAINQDLILDQVSTISLSYNVPEDWVAENCEIIVFVSSNDDDNEVLQAEASHLIE